LSQVSGSGDVVVVLVTVPSIEVGERIAPAVVPEHLAEVLLLIKTTSRTWPGSPTP
jgi:uncharacterized protein involved in tolerance to divalent cations